MNSKEWRHHIRSLALVSRPDDMEEALLRDFASAEADRDNLESNMASLADCINTEARENRARECEHPVLDEMRRSIRDIVDAIRQGWKEAEQRGQAAEARAPQPDALVFACEKLIAEVEPYIKSPMPWQQRIQATTIAEISRALAAPRPERTYSADEVARLQRKAFYICHRWEADRRLALQTTGDYEAKQEAERLYPSGERKDEGAGE